MQRIFVEHIFDIPRDVFVDALFFDEAFNKASHDHMNFRSRTVLEDREDDASRFMRIEYITGEKLPWVARKLFGHDDVGWIETLEFDKAAWAATITMRPHILADRIKSHGVMTFHNHEGGRTRRTFDIEIDVTVPAVGGAIARKMCSDTEKNFDKMVAFTNRWIADQGLAQAS